MISIAHPFLGVEEGEAVLRVFASRQLAQGENVAAFEQLFTEEVSHVREAMAISSGNANLYLVLLALRIDPGEEVIIAACSSAITVAVTSLSGTSPGFLDLQGDFFPTVVEEAVVLCA